MESSGGPCGGAELLADACFAEDPCVRTQQDGYHAATRYVESLGWREREVGADHRPCSPAGLYPLPPGISSIIGVEFAGVVEVGSAKWKVGDEVFVLSLQLSF